MQFDRLQSDELITLMGAALAGAALCAIVVTSPALPQGKHITVLAAASMQNALDDINTEFTKSTHVKVIAGYAASSALIKQIAQGAEADVLCPPTSNGWISARKGNSSRTTRGSICWATNLC
jgi:ABC-type molybdate transport system substrate-binding protein